MRSYSSLRRLAFVLAATSLALQGRAAPETWKIDPPHSSVGFNVRHFLAKVPGWYTTFEGTIVFDPANPSASKAEAIIEASSISTNNGKRDAHLKTEDFFLTEKFPKISFKSTSWKKTGDNTFEVTGDLTIKDVTKPITLNTILVGTGPGARNTTISAWEASAKLDRRDFGLTYGKGVVGNDVEIVINIEAIKQ